MSIIRDIRDNKIQRNIGGEVLSSSAVESSQILHIDTDLQLPNRIHKSDTNEVSQITDKAQNIAFTGSCGYDYENGFVFNGVNDKMEGAPIELATKSFSIIVKMQRTSTVSVIEPIINRWNNSDINTSEFLIDVTLTHNYRFYVSKDGTRANRHELTWDSSIEHTNIDTLIIAIVQIVGNNAYIGLYGCRDLVNGIFYLRDKITTTANNIFQNNSQCSTLLGYTDSGLYGGINLKGVEILNSAVFDVQNDSIGDIYGDSRYWLDRFNLFHYHQRYKDGELYLSSKYLKDALIDTDNRIERIYNSIKETYFEQTVLSNRPRRTEQGIEYLSGESLLQAASDEYTYGTGDFFLGRWVDFKNESVVFSIGGIIEIGIDATNIYTETSGGKLYANRANAINEGFKYIGFHCENDNIYLSIDGYLENSRAESVDYNTNQIATIGGLFVGTDTDMYNAKESIVSFIGKTQGQKVFEPPRRGGFNSDIKQY